MTPQLSYEFHPVGVDLLLPLAQPPAVVLVLVEAEAEGIGAVAAEAWDVSTAAVQLLEDIGEEDLIIG